MARDGDQADGLTIGENYRIIGDSSVTLLLNNSGQTALYALAENRRGIWLDTSGTRQLVAITNGDQGLEQGATWSVLETPVLNSAGQLAFSGDTQGNLGNQPSISGIWSGLPGQLNAVAREFAFAPGVTAGRTFSGSSSVFENPSINAAGVIAFAASSEDPNITGDTGLGIWAGTSESLRLVMHSGGYALEHSKDLDLIDVSDPLISSSGAVAFRGQLRSGDGISGNNDSGIWSEGSGGLSLIVQEGDPVSGLTGFVFGELFTQSASNLAINAAGQVAFEAVINNTVTQENSRAVFAQDPHGELQLIARRDDTLEIAPHDSRTISDLRFVGGGGDDDGRSTGFNNRGQVAFYAAFEGGGSGVFVSDLAANTPNIAGDFNSDAVVNGDDLIDPSDGWNVGFGSFYVGGDFLVWQRNFGMGNSRVTATPVPEPTTTIIITIFSSVFVSRRRRI